MSFENLAVSLAVREVAPMIETPLVHEVSAQAEIQPMLAAEPMMGQAIGALLVRLGKISVQDVERVLDVQKSNKLAFGEAAINLKLVTEADIQNVLAYHFDYPYLQNLDKQFSPKLYAAYSPFSVKGEALRDLRSQLLMRWFGKGHKMLTITGVEAGDKASELAANLAITLSQLGKNTLLIDASLRKPTQHTLFNLENRQGLSNRLVSRIGSQAWGDSITQISSFPNLSVLTAGSSAPNPLELLERANFSMLLAELSTIYDVILLDTAPLFLGSDALAVAAQAGGMLMSVRKNHSRMDAVDIYIEKAKTAGVETLGFVMQE